MEKAFVNIVGKGENAVEQHFLLCLRCFPSYPMSKSPLMPLFIYCLQVLLIWSSFVICYRVTGWKTFVGTSGRDSTE